MEIGKSIPRLDAYDKAAGRAKYTGDLIRPGTLTARLVHASIAHGAVLSVDTAAAEAVEGVVKVFTCFDVPDIPFPTAGHPWSTDPHHQDVADRHLLTKEVRYFGDDIAVVVAEDEVAAARAAKLVTAQYEEKPFVLDETRRAPAPRALPGQRPGPHGDPPGGLRRRHPGAGPDPRGGLVQGPHGAALPH